ncbi:NAD(P)H-hydrate dehydratase [Lacticaseibacillus baoqingensis]|uniref:ADP-dependent (S)-NAD(P)H-hydrate dehydratase n=1 Tax=Lacticaseibacillus baoqingensis TaxID=2486013 RepID=A0ABW4E6G6_9LACO|nr:NAD(P)H-hydrate dehydratase [Lacticaseibacillus baoqingensis]
MQLISATLVQQVIQPRPTASYKGNYGRILIVGGNARFGGAAILSASAAVYAGGGLVSVATDAVNRDALHARLPEAMIIPYDDANLADLLQSMTVIVIGPGLGTDETALKVLNTVFEAVAPEQTLIIDGSAITLVATHHMRLPKARFIWTPHQMEWQRLSGIAIAAQTPAANQAAAAKLPGTVIVKSHRSEIFTPTRSYQNPVGSPAMATGGSGDTLTGIIAAFVGQFGHRDASILAAVYTHSAVADLIASDHYVALPSMVIQALPGYMAKMAAASAND